MADNKIRKGRVLWSVGVTLLLFALAPCLTCISLQRLSKTVQQGKRVNDAAATEVRTGRILFNGKDINVRSRSSSVATEDNSGLAHVDLPQSDGTGILEQAFQLAAAQEAAWRRLNPLLSCGQTKMKLKALGPEAAYLQLDMGVFNGIVQSLPLMQVPTSCGYSMRQNALGLVLVVPYDGCSVVQENGYNVLPLSWLQNPVKLACPLSQSATTAAPPPTTAEAAATTTTATTTTTPLQTTRNAPARNPPANPLYPYFPYVPYYPFGWPQSTVAPATTAPTTSTAQPVTTSYATTSASTSANLPAANPNFPPFPYGPFYPPFGLSHPTVAPATPASTMVTAQPSTPAMPTTGPALKLPVYPYHPYYTWYASDPLNVPTKTTLPPTTTTASPTPGLPVQPNPNYPIYQNYPVGIPSQSAFYYPYIQPPYPQNLNPFTGCSSDQSSTAPFASTSACLDKMPNGYLDISQYSSYDWFPFRQYMWHNRAGKHPYGWRYRSQAGYLPGMQTWAQPYPGFMYQQPMPWFSYSPGQDTAHFDWRNIKGV